jgi:hypothetical protein
MYILWLLRRHRALIGDSDRSSFLSATGLLALSLIVDAVQEILPIPYGWSQIAEEGCKFVGAAAWLYFWGHAAAHRLSCGAGAQD